MAETNEYDVIFTALKHPVHRQILLLEGESLEAAAQFLIIRLDDFFVYAQTGEDLLPSEYWLRATYEEHTVQEQVPMGSINIQLLTTGGDSLSIAQLVNSVSGTIDSSMI